MITLCDFKRVFSPPAWWLISPRQQLENKYCCLIYICRVEIWDCRHLAMLGSACSFTIIFMSQLSSLICPGRAAALGQRSVCIPFLPSSWPVAGLGMESTPRKTESGTALAAIRGHPASRSSSKLLRVVFSRWTLWNFTFYGDHEKNCKIQLNFSHFHFILISTVLRNMWAPP